MQVLSTLSEGQQQQRWQSGDDGGEQKHATPTKAIDGLADKDAGQCSGQHSKKVAKVEVGGVTSQVSGETVLNSGSNKPRGEVRESKLWTSMKHTASQFWYEMDIMFLLFHTKNINLQCETEDEAVFPDNSSPTQLQNWKVSRPAVFSVCCVDFCRQKRREF